MDFASLLVSILVAGAIGQTKVPFNFYRLHRYEGQLLHLKVLTSGVLYFSLAKERKVYVGIIQTMGEPTEKNSANQEVVIFPVLSGYRDENTLEVRFTTAYDIPSGSKSVIALCIKTEQISSISYFDFDVYESTRLQRNTSSSLGVT